MLDHLGSVVGLFSASGVWEGGYSYSPYGETRVASNITSAVVNNTLRYIGGEHDMAGIYKLGARYYDSALGRFTQMDPSGQEAHPYGYSNCNPINSKDVTGLAPTNCSTALLIIGTANGVVWSVAGLLSVTLAGGAVAAAAGLGITFGLSVVSLWCP